MPGRIREENLCAIEDAVRQYPEGRTAQQISDALAAAPPRRTLQYRLKSLVNSKRLVMEGTRRWARYRVPRQISVAAEPVTSHFTGSSVRVEIRPSLSEPAAEIRGHVRQPMAARQPVGYDRAFLDSYQPNHTFYLSRTEREHLREVGTPKIPEQPAGTYARQILNRLLIDLSWNSSRLEGNTYSLLDTTHLLEIGEEAEGKERLEGQMILNHKDAIEFLVDAPEDIGFNRHTITNLHALLADNLLADPDAPGRLRHIVVDITGSVFHPLAVPQLIEECFDQILATASTIRDPFEKAFFVMVQLPYLQPFDDVNKRVSRLAANIPLIKANLSPLSFEDTPVNLYAEAILGMYELKRVELLRDVFIWAYERSAAHVSSWTQGHVAEHERERFRQVAERELLGLHERNFARYRIRPSGFTAWQEAWGRQEIVR